MVCHLAVEVVMYAFGEQLGQCQQDSQLLQQASKQGRAPPMLVSGAARPFSSLLFM
jgi:hypothetical protein